MHTITQLWFTLRTVIVNLYFTTSHDKQHFILYWSNGCQMF